MTSGGSLHAMALCAGAGMLEEGVGIAVRWLAENGYYAPGTALRPVCYVEREITAASRLVARMEEQASLDPAPVWDDIGTFDGKPWRGRVHTLTAGYPCQPFSQAGRRRGAKDERHLWPDIARIIGDVEPVEVVLENVAGHLSLGFPQVGRELQAVHLCINFYIFDFFSRTIGPILTRLGTNHPWGKGIEVCSNEGCSQER